MNTIFVGNTPLNEKAEKVAGAYVELKGETFQDEKFYRIENYDQIPPFFMSIVSDSDHWMFISSNGALTAGRKDANNALFPYYTVDKITDSPDVTGSKTIFLVQKDGKKSLWEPFSNRFQQAYLIQRNLYKNVYGNRIVFEEVNNDLGLVFTYSWSNSEKFGFVRESVLTNTSPELIQVEVLDGIQNILPYGATAQLQNEYSNLLNAYKKNELVGRIAAFTLSSILTDRAEPSEALKSTLVWSVGLPQAKILLSSLQLDNFRYGKPVHTENDIRAQRGAYLLNATLKLAPKAAQVWQIVSEINCDMLAFTQIDNLLKSSSTLHSEITNTINADIAKGTFNLKKIVGNADGLQLTADTLSSSRHFANVLFNVMRGGIFDANYGIDKADFVKHLTTFNAALVAECQVFIDALPEQLEYTDLIDRALSQNDTDLQRLAFEYLPLTFSRRHGDPSRPWNKFSIQTKTEAGEKVLYYQGNWRDIFQNWEALSLSFPSFIEGMITKFVNASTVDGYNPYRITRDGIDWETIEPDNPWSNIGYWGDHQIIYLLKLLEVSANYHPGKLNDFITRDMFAYANVPYRIKGYNELLQNPQDTILFDQALEKQIEQRVREMGADGKLVLNSDGEVVKVNLAEKLLVTLLAKLSNFIPEAGIWLSTQRPEWNDANNALVGNGVSMVTLYYMRRYLSFLRDLFTKSDLSTVSLSEELSEMLSGIFATFANSEDLLQGSFTNAQRKQMMDELGNVGEQYRESVYAGFADIRREIEITLLVEFFDLALQYMDHSIRANKRADNLYHAYNLITIGEHEVSIRYLYEMLEGQVSVLASGALSTAETVELMDALRASKMYRANQNSYMLYPDRERAWFIDRNTISAEQFASSKLLKALVASGDRSLVVCDENGLCHFNAKFTNAKDVRAALLKLDKTPFANLAETEGQLVLAIFEQIFDHKSFTGRSGTFYGYEGLGSIYWHMVSKLVLGLEEACMQIDDTVPANTAAKLVAHYYEARAGIGYEKSPEVYGGFPTDPYSHTPGDAGVQQPGMTGQVKEDIISRFGELGVSVAGGKISFASTLLRQSEFLAEAATFEFFDAQGQRSELSLAENQLAFTICQVPVVYTASAMPGLRLLLADGKIVELMSLEIGEALSAEIFNRTGAVVRIEVSLTPQV